MQSSKRFFRTVSIPIAILAAAGILALGSCQLLGSTQGTSIQGRIDAFNADLTTYNWSDLVNQFSNNNTMKSSGQMNDPTAFFSNYPFSQGDNPSNPGQIALDTNSIVYNSAKTNATMTATYKPELGTTYTLTITMELNSSDNSWYILEMDFSPTLTAIKDLLPGGGSSPKVPKPIR